MPMLVPDHYYDSVFHIPYDDFYAKKIRGLIFDLDNTLTPFHEKLPPANIVTLMQDLKAKGFEVCLVTNNTQTRLNGFNKDLKLKGIANALKPSTKGIKKAMALMGTTNRETAIIGDQLLSDVWGGRNAKITTIMVKPITEKDFFFVKMKRGIEAIMLRKYFKELKKNGPQK